MAITGRSADECFDRFKTHVGALVAKMLHPSCPVLCLRPGKHLPQDRRTLRLANEQHCNAVELDTRDHGSVFLYMAQELRAEPAKEGGFRLRTEKYWYKLYAPSPVVNDDAIVRWEYERREPGHRGPCRRHVQFGKTAPSIALGLGSFDLTRFHTPTGWVLMEEVFRFLVHELGVQPPCGDDWPNVLHESEQAFYEKHTDKGGSGF